jgi:hypothetical protein
VEEDIRAGETDPAEESSGVGVDVGAAAVRAVVGAAAVFVLQEHSPGGVDSAEPVASFHVSNDLPH